MKAVVCDASPLIFLAKLNRLDLISKVLQGELIVLKCVVEEVISENAGVVERERLSDFFKHVEVIDSCPPKLHSVSLSRSDQSTLTWAVKHQAQWLVADERLLRKIAREHGLSTIGFLGLLVEGARKGFLSAGDAKAAIDDSVSQYGCRISVALYQRILSVLNDLC